MSANEPTLLIRLNPCCCGISYFTYSFLLFIYYDCLQWEVAYWLHVHVLSVDKRHQSLSMCIISYGIESNDYFS